MLWVLRMREEGRDFATEEPAGLAQEMVGCRTRSTGVHWPMTLGCMRMTVPSCKLGKTGLERLNGSFMGTQPVSSISKQQTQA